MASQSLPHNRSSDEEKNLWEPFLSDKSNGKQIKKKGSIKLSKRLRHVCSAPGLDESNSQLNVDELHLNEDATMPHTQSRNSKRSIILGSVAFIIYLGLGLACFYVMEEDLQGHRTNSFIDALYFCSVTMTTVGYGDLVPESAAEKFLTCIFVFVGFGLVGLLFGKAADFLVERQETMLVKALSETGKKGKEFSEFSGSSQIQKIRLKVVIAGVIFLVLFALGLVVMIEVEGYAFVEAFYLVCVTVTTLGYGDISFQTTGGRAFAVIWILISTVNIAQFFLYIAELFTEERRESVVHLVLTRKTTSSDLEAADMDHDGVVSASEFVVYKLKEMGKIEEQDVVEILREFDSLDVDDSGTLSSRDLKLGEATQK